MMRQVVGSWIAAAAMAVVFGLPARAEAGEAGEAPRYIVKFRDAQQGRAAVAASGGRIVLDLRPQQAAAAHLPERALRALQHDPHIEYVEVDALRHPLSERVPYGIPMVQAPDVPAGAGDIGVCVIDSGFDLGHEDLQSSNVTGYPSEWSTDRCGHGSHVTGTIAALGGNGIGVTSIHPGGVRLHVVKVFDDSCSWSYVSDLIHAANQCQAAGARVINMSLGGGFKSRTEERAFEQLFAEGVLSVAAAGNGGNTRHSYPASYDSVVSVAAVDEQTNVASFSQRNGQVELAAPGVGVLSTVSWRDMNSITVGATTWYGSWLENAQRGTATGDVADGGLCTSAGAWSGRVVLCERGSISFYDKVKNVQDGGGVAAVVYNDVAGPFSGTLGSVSDITIPGIGLSREDGQAILTSSLGASSYVESTYTPDAPGYVAWSGTSMATPHVTGVAARVWSHNPAWTNQQVRDALRASARDLGTSGRDDAYGYGLVQARAALDLLQGGSTAPDPEPEPPADGFTLTVTARKEKGRNVAELSWSGSTASSFDVYRDTALIGTTASDTYTDPLGTRGSATHTYRVCDQGTSTCSNEATVIF